MLSRPVPGQPDEPQQGSHSVLYISGEESVEQVCSLCVCSSLQPASG